jgi:hypothetical protein
MRGKYVIAGIGHTAFGKLGLDTVSLNVQACASALADAGIDKSCVDALLLKVPTSSKEILYGQKVAEAMGLMPRWGGAWDQGGAANIALIAQAVMAMEAGLCSVALVSYADNPRSGNRAVYGRPRGNDALHGWFSTAAGYGMIQRRHMIEYATPWPRASTVRATRTPSCARRSATTITLPRRSSSSRFGATTAVWSPMVRRRSSS